MLWIAKLATHHRTQVACQLETLIGGQAIITAQGSYQLEQLQGLLILNDSDIQSGLLYRVDEQNLYVVFAYTLVDKPKALQALFTKLQQYAQEEQCAAIIVSTTNAQQYVINSLMDFGFRLKEVYVDEAVRIRQQSPDFPCFGLNGVSIRDMYEFELIVSW